MVTSSQTAPGRLEDVRTLLNTLRIPNDTRELRDDFQAYARKQGVSEAGRSLRRLRDELRSALEGEASIDAVANALIRRAKVRCAIKGGVVEFESDSGPAGDLACVVLRAIRDGAWPRLKACPDCRWVFYDGTRNASKRWCMMSGSADGGRGCGTIAKVRAYRRRQARRAEE